MAHRKSINVDSSNHTMLHKHLENLDIYIDMQYARLSCNCPIKFAREPWEHYQDPTETFLSLRYDVRPIFKDKLDKAKKKRVQHEEDRIKQTRINFSSYNNKTVLMSNLKNARKAWREEVRSKYVDRVIDHENRQAKCLKSWTRDRILDQALMKRVKSWIVDEGVDNSVDDREFKPELEPLYGFKACVMHFKKESCGWVGHTEAHQKCSGEFPNQKISMHQLLEEKENNPLTTECGPDRLRYFHLPTNNMRWVEKAVARYYGEDDPDYDYHKKFDEMTRAEKLLQRDFWRGQLHGSGTKGPIHARHMRSRCSLIPLDAESGTYTRDHSTLMIPALSTSAQARRDQKARVKDFAIFMPYLHWETDSRRARMAEIVKEVTTEREASSKTKSKDITRVWEEAKAKKSKKHRQSSAFDKPPPRTKLGEYMLYIAKVADAIDYEADERLLRENLNLDPPMHIRRTLDQYYFLTLEDTGARDKDQVVYRETRAGRSFHTRNTRVVMVDQLWLWILDENTIITSFPRRWGRNKPDPSGVHKSLREKLANKPMGQIKSIYDLAFIIIDQCSRVFFDRTRPLDQRPEVMDLFSSAIGNVTEHKSIAYESFWRNMELRALYPHKYASENLSQKYLDINPEGALLRESQDVAEELRIMLRIYNQQLIVVKDLRKALRHMNGESKNEPDDVRKLMKLLEAWQKQDVTTTSDKPRIQKVDPVPEHTIQEANDLIELLRNRQEEIQDLEEAAMRTSQQLQDLLTLKQQQASIIEAKAALKRADESVKQGRAIMLFTIVTIFFLPLGFFAAFFGMNNKEINGDSSLMTIHEQMLYMFSLSAAVIIVAVSMAFSPWTRATITVLVKVPLAFVAEYTGLGPVWRKYIIDHVTLDRKGQRSLEYIYKYQDRRAAAKPERQKEKQVARKTENEAAEELPAIANPRSRMGGLQKREVDNHIV